MVDIVIPVYGRYDLLKLCLESIPDAFVDVPFRVYVHENGTPIPDQEKKEFFSQYYPDAKVFYGKKNIGFPKACNLAARKGKGKYVFLLNSDVILEPGSGKRMVQYFEADEELGVLGMKLLFPEEMPYEDSHIRPVGKVQHYGISFDITAKPNHIFVGWSPENNKVNVPIEPVAVTGAALMTKRSLWNKVKALDTQYGLGTYEDVDFCFKIRELGLRVMVFPDTVGTHYTGASQGQNGNMFPLEINRNLFYNKWQGKIEWSDGRLL